LECVIAPEYESAALEIFKAKKNLRILTLPALTQSSVYEIFDLKKMRGGALIQTTDQKIEWSADWKILGKSADHLPENLKADLVFSMQVAKHVKSNAIVIVSKGQTIGICGGQTNRVDSVKMALERAEKFCGDNKEWILASDAFFPFRDSVDIAAKFPVKWIIQPGGSLKDQEVIAACEEYKIGLVLTGKRHFKH
jgi:phosphoribosylaminoimidazolecarboxamide formyltransferase/IMP cyclohydrolase